MGIKLAILDFVDNNAKEYLFKYPLYENSAVL